MEHGYRKTIIACFAGYVAQAIVNIFVPLLFLTFQNSYGIPLEKITLLIAINFVLQILTDLAATVLVDKVGYRACAVAAHFFVAAGLCMLTVLPEVFSDPFIGLMLAVVAYAIGGGLIEVVISPIVEACPNDHKERTMSLLHSFYCWGSVAVISLSALFFFVFGTTHWKILTLIWAVFPCLNGIFFLFVPLKNIVEEGEKSLKITDLLKNGDFWTFFVLIVCAGASEAGVAQWASAFVESGLHLPKALGDLLGPAFFAVAMGLSRVLFGKKGDRLDLDKSMFFSGILCIFSYLLIAIVPVPAVALCGMFLCGFSVGILWPGTYSSAAKNIRGGGNVMFALLAFGGDIGCVSGPAVVGAIAGKFGGEIGTGILCGAIFPVILTLTALFRLRKEKKNK